MESSVSKGVFVLPHGFKNQRHCKKKPVPLFEKIFQKEPWYETYKRNWNIMDNRINGLHHKMYNDLLNDMVNYIKLFQKENDSISMDGIIPSATLLTGVNQPDHVSQFKTLIEKIREDVTPHVAMVNSQDASTLKQLVENVVWQLIHGNEGDTEDDSDDITTSQKLKKNQCTMKALQKWYLDKHTNISPKKKKLGIYTRSLVIIIPDFESFNCNILQDFVMIVSSYVSTVPIVLVFGVATSVSALHKSFPYHVSSKLLIKVFHSYSSPAYMNEVLEEIFLTHMSPLHFSGKAFSLLSDVFLFYDFSVIGLVRSIMFCMMFHYYQDNTKSLSCDCNNITKVVSKLSAEELENIRQLLSFRPFVEAQHYRTQTKLFDDDNFFREVLCKEITQTHEYLYSLYVCVRLLSVFVKDLPKNGLGNSVCEIYSQCTTENITNTSDFKECMQLLNLQSQVKLLENLKNAMKVIYTALEIVSPVKPLRPTPTKNNLNNIHPNNGLGESFVKTVRVHFLLFLRQIERSNTDATFMAKMTEVTESDDENIPGNRHNLKEKLLQSTRAEKIQSEFEMIRSRFVSYLEEMFVKGLQPPRAQPFHEIFFFGDVADVKKQIVGAPRGAIHTALSNPEHYLQCSCCHLSSAESLVASLPDVCLAYKLHRECGKHINMYDWLQAFAAVLRPGDEDGQRHQDNSVQVRFQSAVAELQLLGFIKPSKRKTDHVMRLTW